MRKSKVSDGIYKLSDYQKKRIDLSRKELVKGQTITHENLQKEIELLFRCK